MKAKNILWLGVISVGLYYLLKQNKAKSYLGDDENKLPDEADVDLKNVINGVEPSSLNATKEPKKEINLKEVEVPFRRELKLNNTIPLFKTWVIETTPKRREIRQTIPPLDINKI